MNQSCILCKLRKAAILAAVCGLQLTAAAQTSLRTVNDTWTVDSWNTATANQVSVFPDAAYYDFTDIVVPETDGGAAVVATFRYSGGSHRQDTYGLEIIDAEGNIVGSDYHTGFTGGSHRNNVYTVSDVPAGTYTMRCWTGGRADNDTNTSTGTLTLTVNDAQAGSMTWNSTSWILDPSKVTAEGLIAVYGGLKVGGNCYKYMDKTIKVGAEASIEITYNYTAGNERVDLIGVEAIDAAGNVVASDGHFGYSGNQKFNNVYTLNLTTSGTYTIRTWSNYVRAMTNTRGNIIYNITEMVFFDNHQPFTIANPLNENGGDGRGLLAYWTGNDVTDAPIAVEMKTGYSGYYRTGWPTSATADGVHTYWAKYTSPNNNTYIYNVETGRFLSTTSVSYNGQNRQGVSLSDIPMAIDIDRVNGGNVLVCAGGNGNRLCFAPYWGQVAGHYALWYDDAANANLCSLVEVNDIEVSADVRAVVEKEVEIIENGGIYVGQYSQEGAAAAQALLSSEGGTRTAEVAGSIRPTMISADGFYRIENAKNTNIAIAQNQASGKFIYANHTDGGNNFIFRFVPVGTETSSNWGGAAEYDTYRLYCVGAEKEGYVAWGTYNTQVSSANVADSKAYKVAEVGSSVFQISAASSNDNCTLSIGNGNTSVADNATGNIVSWNIYGNLELTNTWRICPVETPEASTVVSVDFPASGATACYFHHDAVIPEGYTVKTLSAASNANPELAVNTFYNLTFDRIDGNVVPAGTAAVVENKNGTTGACSFLSTMAPGEYVAASVPSNSNILFGHHEDTPVSEGADNIYGLTVSGSGESTEHVFTPFNESTHQAGQAYLSAAHLGNSFIATPAHGFNLVQHPTVAINEIVADGKADSAPAYDLFGRRTVKSVRGIYIIGGKKVLVK